jgi:hypothetical protein
MQYRDEVQKVKDDIKNICRKKNPKWFTTMNELIQSQLDC